ncbi:autophagy protein 6 [Podila minutissima]|uniref:Autophagy protein 6 n=1 Tax=Podila minutissima TaxID=64525 RepID=A0A9P5SSY8_9FUNG|nr:autophagy protein 6 [Podila minutissima]
MSASSRQFLCQKCKQPLGIDESLQDINSAAFDLLLGARTNQDQGRSDASESFVMLPKGAPSDTLGSHTYIARASIPPLGNYPGGKVASTLSSVNGSGVAQGANGARKPGYSGGVSGDHLDQLTNRTAKANRLRTTGKLFDLMSAKSDVDHPLCQECTDMLLDALAKQLRDVSRERDCYIDFLRTVNSNIVGDDEMERLENDIKTIQQDETTSVQALRDIEEQQKKVQDEIALLELESLELDKEEERYWQECNEFQLALQNFHNERDSINLKYDYDSRQLEKLHKTNVYNDTFCIGHDGHFATINGFRLGRLPTQHVDWPEINAAWGQTLLLLHTIANKLSFEFKTYRLVPLGSFSRIDKIEGDRASYELYGSGEFGFGRMFLNRRFDNAMVAFLNCLQQLGDYAEQQGPRLELPYKINKDRIGDASIKLQFSQDEIWTKALKYTLTNTKWILAYASSSAASNMTSYTPSAPSLPISRRSSPAVRSDPQA